VNTPARPLGRAISLTFTSRPWRECEFSMNRGPHFRMRALSISQHRRGAPCLSVFSAANCRRSAKRLKTKLYYPT